MKKKSQRKKATRRVRRSAEKIARGAVVSLNSRMVEIETAVPHHKQRLEELTDVSNKHEQRLDGAIAGSRIALQRMEALESKLRTIETRLATHENERLQEVNGLDHDKRVYRRALDRIAEIVRVEAFDLRSQIQEVLRQAGFKVVD